LGAKKIYAAGSTLEKLNLFANFYPGIIVPIVLDITSDRDILDTGAICRDINMLINNAGTHLGSSFIGCEASINAMYEMKVNYFGVLALINRMLPALKRNEESFIVNIMFAGNEAVIERTSAYCASKSALHTLTQSIREELRNENVHVFGAYPAYKHTTTFNYELFAAASPEQIAMNICTGINNGTLDMYPNEVLVDTFPETQAALSA
jgi:short-subunit dehydrogenase